MTSLRFFPFGRPAPRSISFTDWVRSKHYDRHALSFRQKPSSNIGEKLSRRPFSPEDTIYQNSNIVLGAKSFEGIRIWEDLLFQTRLRAHSKNTEVLEQPILPLRKILTKCLRVKPRWHDRFLSTPQTGTCRVILFLPQSMPASWFAPR